jgi:hypothetical protein
MMIKSIPLKKLKNLLLRTRNHPETPKTTSNIQQEIRMALLLGRPARISREDQAELEIKVNAERSNTNSRHLLGLGLDHPPSHHQLEILKHFKVKNRSELTRSQASILIKTIFSDPVKIKQWKHRPATSQVKQGILFMGGQLNSSMTQIEAQSKLLRHGKEQSQRFTEWKHIETLFLLVNSRDSLEQHNARKLTWKCFFEIYDDLKSSGLDFSSINADSIRQHAKMIAFAKKPLSCQIKTFAA